MPLVLTEVMNELILYRSDDGQTRLHLRAKNIFADGELDAKATVKESLTVQTEGERHVKRKLIQYNLDLILAIGYRVRSSRGVQFRQWASTHLKEFLRKGFVMDDERLKNPTDWETVLFFAEVQNKLLYSVTRYTADELDTLNRLVVIFLEQADVDDLQAIEQLEQHLKLRGKP